jgi:hypothetical protein
LRKHNTEYQHPVNNVAIQNNNATQTISALPESLDRPQQLNNTWHQTMAPLQHQGPNHHYAWHQPEGMSQVPPTGIKSYVNQPEGMSQVPPTDIKSYVNQPEGMSQVPPTDIKSYVNQPEGMSQVPPTDIISYVNQPEGMSEVPTTDIKNYVNQPEGMSQVPTTDIKSYVNDFGMQLYSEQHSFQGYQDERYMPNEELPQNYIQDSTIASHGFPLQDAATFSPPVVSYPPCSYSAVDVAFSQPANNPATYLFNHYPSPSAPVNQLLTSIPNAANHGVSHASGSAQVFLLSPNSSELTDSPSPQNGLNQFPMMTYNAFNGYFRPSTFNDNVHASIPSYPAYAESNPVNTFS